MPQLNNILIWLWQKLYPTDGRAWNMPMPVENVTYYTDEDGEYLTDEAGNFLITEDSTTTGGIFYRLHRALSIQFAIAWEAARGVQDAQLPDNPRFTIDDAHDWYRRLGIYDSGLVSLADMKAAITQRMSFPLVPLDKQSLTFIQAQLQLAGFNVFLYKNNFSGATMTPYELLGTDMGIAMHGAFQHGALEHGQITTPLGTITKIVTYLEEAKDALFDVGANMRATFYIAGATITDFADVPLSRKIEFRQLVLKYKAAQMCGIAFINYT